MVEYSIMKKILLCYPPGDLSKKIKKRYKFNTLDVVPPTMRACNDLGYMAATLQGHGHEVFLKDYKIEESSALDFLDDVLKFSPNVIVMTTSAPNLLEDLKLVRMIKSSSPEIVIALKSDLFFDPSNDVLCNLPLGGVDYLIGSDAAFVLPLLVKAHFEAPHMLYQVPFITICRNGLMQKTNFHAPHGSINDLPLPARDLMKNEYYYRPDNQEVIATIITSKGCKHECLHCKEHILSNGQFTARSPKSVYDEMLECYTKYEITNFFFPVDNFTSDEKWVEALCDLIQKSPMQGNIEWIVNVNIMTFTEYMAQQMKAAGCSLAVMRFDSGSDDSLARLKREITVDECVNAAEIARKAKIKIFGLYSMGLPWENEEHLKATRKMMFKICADFISLSLPVLYPDTPMEKAFRDENILREPLITKEGIKIHALGTKFLTHKFVRRYRRKTILLYYTHPKFMFKKFLEGIKDPSLFKKYMNFLSDLFGNKRR